MTSEWIVGNSYLIASHQSCLSTAGAITSRKPTCSVPISSVGIRGCRWKLSGTFNLTIDGFRKDVCRTCAVLRDSADCEFEPIHVPATDAPRNRNTPLHGLSE